MCVHLRHPSPRLCPYTLSLCLSFPVGCQSSATHWGLFLCSQDKAARSSWLVWASLCQQGIKCWEINSCRKTLVGCKQINWPVSGDCKFGKALAKARERSHSWSLRIGAHQHFRGPAKLSTDGKTQAPRRKGRTPMTWPWARGRAGTHLLMSSPANFCLRSDDRSSGQDESCDTNKQRKAKEGGSHFWTAFSMKAP